MKIQEAIAVINQIQADGIIERYATGGAVAATFYLEPVATIDLEIFVLFKANPNSLIINPQPLYDYLIERGCTMEGEYVMIAGWPVQFLPPTGALVEEALEKAINLDIEGVPMQVFSAEHLASIALQTGRAKDKARLLQFIEEGALDVEQFQSILIRHQLEEPWQRFEQQFLQG